MTEKMQRLPLRHPEQGKGFSHPADRCTPQRAWKGGFVDRVTAPAPPMSELPPPATCCFLAQPLASPSRDLAQLRVQEPSLTPQLHLRTEARPGAPGEGSRVFPEDVTHLPRSPADICTSPQVARRWGLPPAAPPWKTRWVGRPIDSGRGLCTSHRDPTGRRSEETTPAATPTLPASDAQTAPGSTGPQGRTLGNGPALSSRSGLRPRGPGGPTGQLLASAVLALGLWLAARR